MGYTTRVKVSQMVLQGLFWDSLCLTASSYEALVGFRKNWNALRKNVAGLFLFCFSLSNPSLYLTYSHAHHQFTLLPPTDSRMKFSAPYFFNLLAKWQSGSGLNSLGGHRKSLTRGLFAARHYTWAETVGQRQMCLMVGGRGWMQCGSYTNKTRTMETISGFIS